MKRHIASTDWWTGRQRADVEKVLQSPEAIRHLGGLARLMWEWPDVTKSAMRAEYERGWREGAEAMRAMAAGEVCEFCREGAPVVSCSTNCCVWHDLTHNVEVSAYCHANGFIVAPLPEPPKEEK